jgi:hypothetical protein
LNPLRGTYDINLPQQKADQSCEALSAENIDAKVSVDGPKLFRFVRGLFDDPVKSVTRPEFRIDGNATYPHHSSSIPKDGNHATHCTLQCAYTEEYMKLVNQKADCKRSIIVIPLLNELCQHIIGFVGEQALPSVGEK